MPTLSVGRALGVLLAVIVLATAGLTWYVEREIQAPMATGAFGRPRALVVVHPGLSALQDDVTSAFTASLMARGWSIDQTTPSASTTTDLAPYDLLVLGGPTYYWAPPLPLTRYVQRLGDLKEKPVALVMTAGGAGSRALRLMRELVERQHGTVRAALMLFVLRPNREDPESMARPNRDVAVEMAAEAGRTLSVPRP